jgi:uncharacterized protein YfbU (UPF0304 family)
MGFFPENSRVEFQGIGRAGRQGQLGSAQVIFSKDEKFFNGHFINSVDDAEMFRMNELIKNSEIRIISSYFEFELYDALKLFFQKLDDIQKLFNNEYFHICFDDICSNKHLSYDTFKIILTQGLNRQIRRMCEACNYRVRDLKRVRIMNLTLDGIPEGQYREIKPEEYKELEKLLRHSTSTPKKVPGYKKPNKNGRMKTNKYKAK